MNEWLVSAMLSIVLALLLFAIFNNPVYMIPNLIWAVVAVVLSIRHERHWNNENSAREGK